ncbi:MAG: phosphate regulon sensor histidine kinase PhoR [Proteobacteria bacterium]|nr:phosphate regulon sensor histidine kinase PhoR [Pseudomonadota bacterium]
MREIWIAGLAVPAAAIVVAALVYALGGPVAGFAVLALLLLAIVIWHLTQVVKLVHWADGELDAPVPEGHGAWRIPFTRIYRRVRARAAVHRDLAHTIARFQSAAEAVPDGMVVLDAANRIRWANRRAQRQLGIAEDGDIGTPLANLLREPEFIRYLEGGDYTQSVVVPSARESGVTLSMLLVPFGVDEKLIICRDITELEAVARMRRDFIANVSHELKTPLTVISGFVETMQDMDLDAHQRERYLALMEQQAQSMRRLVADLLTLSALESEQSPAADTTFAVEPLLRAVYADALALSAGDHAITLDAGPAATLVGARDEIASAFSNLVTNAIRYTPKGGRIALAWSIAEDGSGMFSVRDTGIGIAPEHIPRLTERFYRVDRSRSRATGGTGLGLAIVKHVLLRHQATLEVASVPGSGSTFSVRLPARRVHRLPAAEGARETAVPARG